MITAGRVHIVGVRHHSPACGRLVRRTIQRLKPAYVLIEGPSDMNDRIDELLLGHELPIAVFSFHAEAGARMAASWSPFSEHSPEWQALVTGREEGARVLFMDLPAWHKAFWGIENRYGDHGRRHARAVARLCRRYHVEGYDALWDHLFEGPADAEGELEHLAARLDAYFEALRGDEAPSDRDGPREGLMRGFILAALRDTAGADAPPIVAVCGGYHQPALAVREEEASDAAWPVVEPVEGAKSYLVPWSHHRLDSMTGYEAGMPSPTFYEAVFHAGARRAPELLLRVIVEHLRAKRHHVSSADLIAAVALSEGLARLRGHACLLRTDLLDGLAAALVKDALDAPMPWTERGAVRRETDALLVELLVALSGRREGRLAARTPRPPLLDDFARELEAKDLSPGPLARVVKLSLQSPEDLERSRVLHRARVLEIPGFTRQRGPAWASDPTLEEAWTVARSDQADSALIEASRFGATLLEAAARRLEDALEAADLGLDQLAALLGEAVFIGIDGLTDRALAEVRRHAAREPDLGKLGAALARLFGLFSQDVLFGARGSRELGAAISEAYARGLWLLEHVSGATGAADRALIDAVRALRDVARRADAAGVSADEAAFVFERRAIAIDAPPAVRGACLGAAWSLGRLGAGDEAAAATAAAIRRSSAPTAIGDFLAGLFALAREETVHGDRVLAAVDEVIAGVIEHDFLMALPALRLAFSYFPPREKADLAARIARRHGRTDASVAGLLALDADPRVITRGRELDLAVERLMVRFGLEPPGPLEGARGGAHGGAE